MKAFYIVSEPTCLEPGSGAHQHIQMGIQELGNYFEMRLVSPCKVVGKKTDLKSAAKNRTQATDKNKFRGLLRDCKRLVINTYKSYALLKRLKKKSPRFVYFRANYLDPLPIIAKLLKVPCFVESNGVQFKAQRQYYRSYFEPIAGWIEKRIYTCATYVFFVGSYGDYWGLKRNNWEDVENGVEQSFLSHFPIPRVSHQNRLSMVFVGSLMAHHDPDVLVNGVRIFADSSECELHLVGTKLDSVATKLGDKLRVVSHGFLDRAALANVLKSVDVGIVSGAPQYQSQMKLFDYGAARLAVVAPATHHLVRWHEGSLDFFVPKDAESLASVLVSLSENRDRLAQSGNRLHDKVRELYAWDKVFAKKANVIKREMKRIDTNSHSH